MGKNKLKKFSELENLSFVYQYPRARLLNEGFSDKGKWRENIFRQNGPIVLELGCGKGEYTVALAKKSPEKNFVGIDIKGARIWTGAKEIEKEKLINAKFLRTEIENLTEFFAPGEIDEIWITFPDPQMQKTRKRLTSTRFMDIYDKILKPGAVIHLKTDSPFLFAYTSRMIQTNGFDVIKITDDLYGTGGESREHSIKTFYESQWLNRGKKIKLISFRPKFGKELKEPEIDDIPKDDYRAYARPTATKE